MTDIRPAASELITQYRESENLKGWIDGWLDLTQREIIDGLQEVQDQLSLDTAGGVWLDFIGERLGYSRPNRRMDNLLYFGFGTYNAAGDRMPDDLFTGWNQEPFYDAGQAVMGVAPIPDNWYRSMLKARGISIIGGTSIENLDRVAQALFNLASYVTETPTMTANRFGFAPDPDRFIPAVHSNANQTWGYAPFVGDNLEINLVITIMARDSRKGFIQFIREQNFFPRTAGIGLTIQDVTR